jgi:hypothetical protein
MDELIGWLKDRRAEYEAIRIAAMMTDYDPYGQAHLAWLINDGRVQMLDEILEHIAPDENVEG